MTMQIRGNLADRLVGDLIREIAINRKSGLLSVSNGDITKGLYFNDGAPVGSVSTIPEEQLETILIREGHASAPLLDCAKLLCGQQPIGQYLVERDLVAQEVISGLTANLSRRIALSLFEWEEGEFALDESALFNGTPAIECSAADLIVEGVRAACSVRSILEKIAPPDRVVNSITSEQNAFAASAHLNSVESYILSGVTSPIALGDIASHLGLAEEEARAALCVLLTLGLLGSEDGREHLAETISGKASEINSEAVAEATAKETSSEAVAEATAREASWEAVIQVTAQELSSEAIIEVTAKEVSSDAIAEAVSDPDRADFSPRPEERVEALTTEAQEPEQSSGPPETLEETISRQLQSLEAADFYHVLGVGKDADAETIIRSHGELDQMFDFYKALYPDDTKLIERLDALSEKIRRAKVTLTDPNLRLRYDLADPNAAESEIPISKSDEPKVRLKEDTEPQESTAPESLAPEATVVRPQVSEKPRQIVSATPAVPLVQSIPKTPSKPAGATVAVANAQPLPRPRTSQRRQGRPISAEQVAHHNYMQGRSRYDQKDVHAAEHLFREAVRLNPNEPNHHYYLALTLLILSQAHHAHTHDKGCHVTCNLGGALMSNPRLRYEAAKHLEKAGELSPFNSAIPLRLGLLFKEANLANKARLYFRRTLELDPKNEIALREVATGSTGPLEMVEGFDYEAATESNSKNSRGRVARG